MHGVTIGIRDIVLNTIRISNFILKIRPMVAEFFHADGEMDRHNEFNSRFSQVFANVPKTGKISAFVHTTTQFKWAVKPTV